MARIEYPGSSGSNKLGALAGNYVHFLFDKRYTEKNGTFFPFISSFQLEHFCLAVVSVVTLAQK